MRPSRSTSGLIVLSSAMMIFLTGVASAQDTVNGGRPNDQPDAAGPIASATAPQEQSLPDIESLTRDADFTVFMRPGVPDEVRVKALRKLWTLDPVYNEVAPHE
jgi:hypothetical protein